MNVSDGKLDNGEAKVLLKARLKVALDVLDQLAPGVREFVQIEGDEQC